jgi:transposase
MAVGVGIYMKAYSLDLRQKIIEVYKQDELSQRQLARHFRVTLGFISKLLKQYRETGEMGSKIRTQQTPTKLNPEQLGILTRLVESQNAD